MHEFIIKKKRDKQLCLSQSKSEICIVKIKKKLRLEFFCPLLYTLLLFFIDWACELCEFIEQCLFML